jgi:ribonuclease BN (tRNA processing enzyme)|nr:MAG TPA: RNaseZ [Caudoviricetes sp.]
MQTLKFLGRGSAFNTKEGNTAAYIKQDSHLLLIDCGENIFERMVNNNLLDGIEKVDVLITHLNSDHVGSLSSLIYYCCFIKKFKVNVYFPSYELQELLKLMGHKREEYNFYRVISIKKIGNIAIMPMKVSHIETMNCYSYFIRIYNEHDKWIYYSGDSNKITLDNEDLVELDEIYQDTSSADYEGNVHLSLKKLCETIPVEYRHKVYCMHIDKDELIKNAKNEGFNVVELT